MEEQYLKVGKILKTQGLKGEVRIYSTTSFKDIRYKKGNKLYVQLKDSTYHPLIVNSFYTKGENLDVVSFKNYDSIESITPFIGLDLLAIKDESILYDDEYFFDDLTGLIAFDENKNKLGEVIKVEEFPSQITLKIQVDNKKHFYVPFNNFFIKEVNIEEKILIIHVIEGLIE